MLNWTHKEKTLSSLCNLQFESFANPQPIAIVFHKHHKLLYTSTQIYTSNPNQSTYSTTVIHPLWIVNILYGLDIMHCSDVTLSIQMFIKF